MLRAQSSRPATATPQTTRITFLLSQLAEQARSSEDLPFAVRAQSQAATLLWPHDCERARAIFRRAFESVVSNSFKPGDAAETNSAPARRPSRAALSVASRQQLRTELLNQIAARDPELAEELARSLAYLADGSKEENAGSGLGLSSLGYYEQDAHSPSSFVTVSTKGEVERRELVIGVALQIAERDPYRAMSLGQLSLSSGISPNFARLLMLMRTVDSGLADLLFSSAVARLEQSQAADLADIHTLGSYLASPAGSATKETLSKSVIARFLNLAFSQIMRRSSQARLADSGAGASDAGLKGQSAEMETAAAYFIGRQLGELFARYLPDRLPQLQRKIAELSEAGPFDRVVDPGLVNPTGPADIAQQARGSSDERERNALYARASLAWLAKGEVSEAQSAASKIADVEMRDRVLAQIARRQTSEGRIDDAVAVAQHIEDGTARVSVLVRLAGAALASSDRVRATELLNEAETEAIKARASTARAQALLTIVNSFSSFDVLRAFEVMQAAVKTINDTSVAKDDGKMSGSTAGHLPADRAVSFEPDDLYRLNFEGTLGVLARADFDRALLLAQQLGGKDVSVIAQLAVCRGGLVGATMRAESAAEDELGDTH